ncbi:hypothetical protein [Methylomarinum vadi]|uniref:hypothetical protein n=1 Tax=Methylomarinum vadi TaxID=438855 RepID=UPI0004DF5762|nr:hypothetical protein [Methylomarinum vadi]
MKFWFYAVILANVMFFLWELQRERFQLTVASPKTAEHSAKQILLLSELPERSVAADGGLSAEENEAKNEPNEKIVAPDAQGAGQVVAMAHDMNGSQSSDDSGAPVLENHDVIETRRAGRAGQDRPSLGEKATEARMTQPERADTGEDESVADSTLQEGGAKSGSERSVVKDETITVVEQANNIADSQPAAEVVTAEQALDEAADDGEEEAILPVCYEVGPFGNKRQLNAWLDNQQIDRKRSEPIYKEQQIPHAYLVYYPAAETFAESKKNEAMLKERGVNDLWLFRKGEMKGMISLGLFREKFRAERLLRQLADRDVAAEMQERYKNEQVLYVRVRQAISLEQPEALTVTDCADSSQAGQ